MDGKIVKLTGVLVGDAQKNIRKFGCVDVMTYALMREPDNPYDPNAIRVAIGPYYMGYIPKHIAKGLAPLIDSGQGFLAEFVKRNESPGHGVVGMTVKIIDDNIT